MMLIDHAHCHHYSSTPDCLINLPSFNQILRARQADIDLILLFAFMIGISRGIGTYNILINLVIVCVYSQEKTVFYLIQHINGCLASSDLLHKQFTHSIVAHEKVQMFEKWNSSNRQ